MKSYNKYIADIVLNNMHNYLETNPQPEAYSTGLYGGKRVREHPQVGHTSYSNDDMTLIPNKNLMLDSSLYQGGSFWDDMGNTFKSVGHEVLHDVVLPVAKDVGKEALTNYLKGSGSKRGRPKGSKKNHKKGGDFLGDLGNIGKSVLNDVVLPVGKEALTNFLKGSGVKKSRGRPKKGAGIGDDILSGIEKFAPIAMMGLGRKKNIKKGGASELYPPAFSGGSCSGGNKKVARGLLIKKIMKEHNLNLPQASKYIKEHNIKY